MISRDGRPRARTLSFLSARLNRKEFPSVEVAAALDIPYAYFYETRPILLCRGLEGNLQAIWPRVKYWR